MTREPPLTAAIVRARVRKIDRMRDDDESAHVAEDELHLDVLRPIADDAPDAPALARAALKTADIAFARWCA